MLFFGVFLRESARTAAKSRTNLSTNSGKAQIWHTSANSYGNGYTPNKLLLETRGGHLGGFRGQTFKSLGKLSNGWTDWHQRWFTSADSSGNGHRLNPSRRSITQGHLGGGLGGHKFKCLGKLSNGWTDWHQIWYKSADSSGNRHMRNTIRLSIPQGVSGGHKFKSLRKLSNSWTDWHQIWYTSADSSGNRHRLNTYRPSISQGAFWGFRGSQIQKSVEAVKRLDRLAPNLGMDIRQTNCPSRQKGVTWGFRSSNIQKSGEAVKRLDRLAPTVVHVCGFIWEWT